MFLYIGESCNKAGYLILAEF